MVHLTSCVCEREPLSPYACAGCDVFARQLDHTIIVFALHFDPAHSRSGSDTEERYARVANALFLSHSSLVLVNNTLPVHVILSGWQDPGVVEKLHARNLHVHWMESAPVPTWAKLWYRGNFCKLNALVLGFRLRRRIIFLDNGNLACHSAFTVLQLPSPHVPSRVQTLWRSATLTTCNTRERRLLCFATMGAIFVHLDRGSTQG